MHIFRPFADFDAVHVNTGSSLDLSVIQQDCLVQNWQETLTQEKIAERACTEYY